MLLIFINYFSCYCYCCCCSSDVSPPLKSQSQSIYNENLLIKTNKVNVLLSPSTVIIDSSLFLNYYNRFVEQQQQQQSSESIIIDMFPGEVRKGNIIINRLFEFANKDYINCSDVQVVVVEIPPNKSKPEGNQGKTIIPFHGLLLSKNMSESPITPQQQQGSKYYKIGSRSSCKNELATSSTTITAISATTTETLTTTTNSQ